MLQSFLIVRDTLAPKGGSALEHRECASIAGDEEPSNDEDACFDSPNALLDAAGLRVQEAIFEAPTFNLHVRNIDAIIFRVAYTSLLPWTDAMEARPVPLPLLWWCDNEPVAHNCVLADAIDGILYPGMTTAELHWSLLLSSKHYLSRTQWKKEREQLIAKLEDRKWIDRAKAILGEVKGISEAEAYEFLRKQAMDERRRMVDVAVSIVKVYSLLREQHPGGRGR